MSNEYKDWMWENRQEAKRVVVILEDAIEILEDLDCLKCSSEVRNQLSISKNALINESNDCVNSL